MITEEEHERRLKVFDNRKSDEENGKALNLSKRSVNYWRKKYCVAGQKESLNKRRNEMLAQGKTDEDIAVTEGVLPAAIRKWRSKHKRPVNHKRLKLFYDKREGKKK